MSVDLVFYIQYCTGIGSNFTVFCLPKTPRMISSVFGGGRAKRTDECYYDYDDSLIRFEKPAKHDGPAEFEFVSSQEGRIMHAGDVMYIVDGLWLDKW